METKDVSVVLAHGAWADGSSWARVITALTANSAKVSAAPLPLTSLADDVAALNRSLDRAEGPIILVGHAYAGAVIALARPERVRAFVYVAALAPDQREKVADVFYRVEPHPQAPKLAPDSNGLIWLPEDAFATAFAQNASADDLAVLAAVQRPISLSCITVPVGRPLWKDLKSWFLVAENDRMIAAETQRFMAERMKAKMKVHVALVNLHRLIGPAVIRAAADASPSQATTRRLFVTSTIRTAITHAPTDQAQRLRASSHLRGGEGHSCARSETAQPAQSAILPGSPQDLIRPPPHALSDCRIERSKSTASLAPGRTTAGSKAGSFMRSASSQSGPNAAPSSRRPIPARPPSWAQYQPTGVPPGRRKGNGARWKTERSRCAQQ
jgi:pimeloyl-ACP methyl ester carboxylesterase